MRILHLLAAFILFTAPVNAQYGEHADPGVLAIPRKATAEDKIQPFLSNCARRISKIWRIEGYPRAKLVCRFRMMASDKFTDLKIEKSSGSKEIDRAALACIRKAQIDRFPKDYVDSAVIQIEFTGSGGDWRNGAGPLIYPKWIQAEGCSR
jgi:TonB family protein